MNLNYSLFLTTQVPKQKHWVSQTKFNEWISRTKTELLECIYSQWTQSHLVFADIYYPIPTATYVYNSVPKLILSSIYFDLVKLMFCECSKTNVCLWWCP